MAMRPYMRAYTRRLLMFMTAYVVLLVLAIEVMEEDWAPTGPLAVLIAILPALPIVGVFWTIGRLLVETDDEYQRLLFTKQVLLATGITLSLTTIWGFLENFGQVPHVVPFYVGVLWLGMLGVSGAIVRWRA